MMSYTMLCTSLCSSAGTLIRRMSPCTRIIGGRPDDRCRSEALFLTTKASSSVRSIRILQGSRDENYRCDSRLLASRIGQSGVAIGLGARPYRPLIRERLLVDRGPARIRHGNDVLPDQFLQFLIECLHAEVPAGLDRPIHPCNLVLVDEVADGGRADQDFVRGDTARAVLGPEQP